jgi:chromosomal replication initiator protein
MLRARLGDDIFTSWFHALEFEGFDAKTVKVSVPVKFLKNWIQSHYSDDLLQCCAAEFTGVERVDVALRQPVFANARVSEAAGLASARGKSGPGNEPTTTEARRIAVQPPGPGAAMGRTHVNGFEGSPLDPRYTFDSFVVGPANRMAHAAAIQVAETVFAEERGFNPLYLHASVGLGKTHLQHAIAWEVKRRAPKANVLYLTAERFRY